jgi:transposase
MIRIGALVRLLAMSNERPKARTIEPERRQGVIRFEMPEDTLPVTHHARVLWSVTGELDLSGFMRHAKAVEGCAGRPAHSPRMLLTLWLYAISRGVGSAREIARLTETDLAYRWITGEMRLSHQALSRFRVGHGEVLEQLMTDVLGTLLHNGLLSLETVAQDGSRVRANASAPSFRSERALRQCLEQAQLHLKAVLAQADDPELTMAQKAAREAGARDYEGRVREAIATVRKLRPCGKGKARASTTDPEARVMKMPDGGYRPGYNLQLAVAGSPMGGPRTVVGLRVTNVGSDMSSLTPMIDDIERRTGSQPAKLLADANHTAHEDIRALSQRGVELLAPVPERTRNSRKVHEEVITDWLARMQTPEAQRTMRARASLCELANAHLKDRFGLERVLVRGTAKVTCVALLGGLAFNLLQHAAHILA